MIDLHLHLLPGVDDGAASLDVARSMLELARAAGFTTLVATPHLSEPLSPAYRARVAAAWLQVAPPGAALGIDVQQGYEIQLTPDLPHRLDRGEPVTLAGGRTVLVELPFAAWPLFTEQTLFDLQTAGYRPLLAHPERYAEAQRDPVRLFHLAEAGVLFQVTYGSLAGLFGKPAQTLAELLLRRDLAAVLATDAHSAGKRFETVAAGHRRALTLLGPDRLRQLTADNPRALLDDTPLPSPAAIREGDDRSHDQPGGFFASLKRLGSRRL